MSSGGASPPELVVGFHPVRELLRHRPQEARALWIGARRGGPRRAELVALAARHGVEVRTVPEAEFDALGPARHNGFALEVAPAARTGGGAPAGDPELVVLLEDIQDPRNLGALLRVCEGAGVGRVLVRDRGSAPLSPAAVKASAGAVEWLPVERVVNSSQEIERWRADGYWIYGADAAGAAPWTVDLTGRVALCLGGEERGLRRLTRDSCDALLGLPMRGRIASLNVATAASALLYEAVRQRTSRAAS
ncbi:MAG TPA: RNA methyltransferase [Thermoanaerobaculia bacterium]|nr:RNA methyltransferase [Thermoanaerobaculia bacterium]